VHIPKQGIYFTTIALVTAKLTNVVMRIKRFYDTGLYGNVEHLTYSGRPDGYSA